MTKEEIEMSPHYWEDKYNTEKSKNILLQSQNTALIANIKELKDLLTFEKDPTLYLMEKKKNELLIEEITKLKQEIVESEKYWTTTCDKVYIDRSDEGSVVGKYG